MHLEDDVQEMQTAKRIKIDGIQRNWGEFSQVSTIF